MSVLGRAPSKLLIVTFITFPTEAAVSNVLLRYAHQRYRQSELYAGEKPAIVLDGVIDQPHIIVPGNDKGPELK